MTVVPVSANVNEIIADVNGVRSVIPRSLLNYDYLSLLRLGCRTISLEKNVYNAFPSAISKYGNSIVAIFSSGIGHGISQRQISIRSDDFFESFNLGTFLENATGVYNNSFLDGLLQNGDVANFKGVFSVSRQNNQYVNKSQSTVIANGEIYAIWQQNPIQVGGIWYTTAYRTSPTPTQTVLVQSPDRVTWTFTAKIAQDLSKSFSEAALTQCPNGDILCIIREDSAGTRDLYLSRSTGNMQAWSSPTLMSETFKGVQPCLMTLANGDILLLVGDRTGQSGLGPSGVMREGINVTGISCWRSSDSGVTWSNQVMLANMWSTDGGQPMAVQLDNGFVGLLCYLAPGGTNELNGVEPGIYWITFDPRGII